jgi:hypothetical protein
MKRVSWLLLGRQLTGCLRGWAGRSESLRFGACAATSEGHTRVMNIVTDDTEVQANEDRELVAAGEAVDRMLERMGWS